MRFSLTDTRLFRGIDAAQLQPLLQCLGAGRKHYARGETILAAGAPTEQLGMVLSGMAMIGHDDIWGNHSLLGHVAPGEVFAEPYACIPDEPLRISVTAAEDTDVLFLNVGKVLTTCTNVCPFHALLIRNLLTVCAEKSLQLSQRILHTAPKGIRARLLSYFSACVQQAGQYSFDIPYNRQQLSDYLGVDRSAMCSELSRMQREGLLSYHKNHFSVHRALEQIDERRSTT